MKMNNKSILVALIILNVSLVFGLKTQSYKNLNAPEKKTIEVNEKKFERKLTKGNLNVSTNSLESKNNDSSNNDKKIIEENKKNATLLKSKQVKAAFEYLKKNLLPNTDSNTKSDNKQKQNEVTKKVKKADEDVPKEDVDQEAADLAATSGLAEEAPKEPPKEDEYVTADDVKKDPVDIAETDRPVDGSVDPIIYTMAPPTTSSNILINEGGEPDVFITTALPPQALNTNNSNSNDKGGDSYAYNTDKPRCEDGWVLGKNGKCVINRDGKMFEKDPILVGDYELRRKNKKNK